MAWLALEEFPVAVFADEFAIPHGDFCVDAHFIPPGCPTNFANVQPVLTADD